MERVGARNIVRSRVTDHVVLMVKHWLNDNRVLRIFEMCEQVALQKKLSKPLCLLLFEDAEHAFMFATQDAVVKMDIMDMDSYLQGFGHQFEASQLARLRSHLQTATLTLTVAVCVMYSKRAVISSGVTVQLNERLPLMQRGSVNSNVAWLRQIELCQGYCGTWLLQYAKAGASGCKRCTAPGRKHCGGCACVTYCSKECQQQDWSRHKPSCLMFRRMEHETFQCCDDEGCRQNYKRP